MRLLLLLALAPLATGDVLPPRPAVRLDAAPRPHELRPARGAAPILLAAKKKPAAAGHSDMAAAGSIAGIALACEIFQYINTGLFFFTLQRLTGATSVPQLAEIVVEKFEKLGWVAFPVYASLIVLLQGLPLMSALVFIVVAGMIFGPVPGTALCSISLSLAATFCIVLARFVAPRIGVTLEGISPRAAAVDRALAAGPASTPLLLITLLRLSPVLPFTFSNYLFGLTSVKIHHVFLGTLVGTLPTQAIYVCAGALGRQALEGGLKVPPALLVGGVVATVLAVWIVGRVAQEALKGLNVDGVDALVGSA